MRTFSLGLAVALLLAMTACGGSTLTPDRLNAGVDSAAQGVQTTDDGAQLAVPEIMETPQMKAEWAQLEADQGTAGVDFHPRRFLVTFRSDAALPAGWSPASPAVLATAQDPMDAELRDYKQFEPLAAAIAQRYGLEIDVQVYRGTQLLAGFKVPDTISDPASVLQRMRSESHGLIAHVIFDPLRYCDFTPNDPNYNDSGAAGTDYRAQWSLRRIKADKAWDYTQGEATIVMAVVDTGVRMSHNQLAGQFITPWPPSTRVNYSGVGGQTDVTDNDSHGTYIAGLMGAIQNDSTTVTGLAPGCKMIPLKISNSGQAADSAMISACNKANTMGAHVVNLSWGGDQPDPNFIPMINDLKSDGVFLAIAAGNENTSGNVYPALYSDICVGATGGGSTVDARAPYSNFGTYVDIAAPGTALKSTLNTGDTAYPAPDNGNGANSQYWSWSGTSFAAPLVAAAAALMWSQNPNLTRDEVLSLLQTTGDSTTGFQTSTDTGQPVRRINLDNVFLQIGSVNVRAQKLDKLIHSGTVSLTATASAATSVSCSVNGNSLGSLTSAPYTWDVDTSAISFGKVSVTFTATDGTDSDSDTLEFIADNGVGAFPLAEYFNPGDARVFDGIDVKNYSPALLSSIKTPGTWMPDTLATAGAGSWTLPTGGGFAGQGAFMGLAGNSYDSWETDCLVSRTVNLSAATNPTLTFRHHHNMENGGTANDSARVLVTADGGQTFTPAKLRSSGFNAVWSGLLANYLLAEVDLSDFMGQTVNVVLLFESNGSVTGEDTGQPKGWWVDNLVLSNDFATAVPTIESVVLSKASMPSGLPQIATSTVVGKALSVTDFDVNVINPSPEVTRVLYWLDFAPFGTLGLEDLTQSTTTGPLFTKTLTIPASKKNQQAVLRTQYFDALNNPGPMVDKTIYVFALRGDTDASGVVNQADLDNYSGKIGLTPSNPNYSVFLDTDLDGVISEADAAGVGYNWGRTN